MIIYSCIICINSNEYIYLNSLINKLNNFSEQIYICDFSNNENIEKTINNLNNENIHLYKENFESISLDNYLQNFFTTYLYDSDYIFWCYGYESIYNGFIQAIINNVKLAKESLFDSYTVPIMFNPLFDGYRLENRIIKSTSQFQWYCDAYPSLYCNGIINFDIFTQIFWGIYYNTKMLKYEIEYANFRLSLFDEFQISDDTLIRYANDLITTNHTFIATIILLSILDLNLSNFKKYSDQQIYALYLLQKLNYEHVLEYALKLYNNNIRRADLSNIIGIEYYKLGQNDDYNLYEAYKYFSESYILGKPSYEFINYYNLYAHNEESQYYKALILKQLGKPFEALELANSVNSIIDENSLYSKKFQNLVNDIKTEINSMEEQLFDVE